MSNELVAPKPAAVPKRLITQRIRETASKVYDLDPDGTPYTYAEAFNRLLWKMALGHHEERLTESGVKIRTYNPPEPWAVAAILSYSEGKPQPVVEEDEGQISPTQKITEMLKDRLNTMAAKALEQGGSNDVSDES